MIIHICHSDGMFDCCCTICVGPLTCETGEVDDLAIAVDCTGQIPSDVVNVTCLLDRQIPFDCKTLSLSLSHVQ